MKVIEIDCWEVKESDFDGRGSSHLAFFSDYSAASDYVSEKNSNWVESPKAFKKRYVIFDTVAEATGMAKKKAIEAAKSKLTTEELELLGLV